MKYTIALLASLAVLSFLPAKAAPGDGEWSVETSKNPMTDKVSSIVTLTGDYLPPGDKRPMIGLRCDGGKFKGAALVTGGPIVAPATEPMSPMDGGRLGLRILIRLNDNKPFRSLALVSDDSKGFSLFGGNFGNQFIIAKAYRVQFDTFPSGSLIADFHPALADSVRVKELCGFK
jgi:hypothetical protein